MLRGLPRALVLRRLAVLAPVALLATLAAPIPASAGVFSAAGARCTIIGTSGDDKLTGTSGRDVICGRGGDDVINSGAGNDIVDGGSGDDVIRGGAGDDKVLGGGGSDRTEGGGGADRVDGGAGNDTVTGGDGGDLVLGGAGNDDLNGEGGKDSLNGGKGTNWCTVGSSDTEKACVYDKTPPTVSSFTVSPARVDVSSKDAQVVVRARVTDDTGLNPINPVQVLAQDFLSAGAPSLNFSRERLVSGTIRDGIWEATATVPRYSIPGVYSFEVHVRDRVGRSTDAWVDPKVTVINATPDTQQAVVRSVSLNAKTFDVRSKAATVTVTARVTDNLSGASDVVACLYSPGGERMQQYVCPQAELVSGTARDGKWRASMTIPKRALGGDWNVGLWVQDRINAGPGYYFGEDVYREWDADFPQQEGVSRGFHLLPNARFAVLGTAETTAAWIKTLKVDRTSVDTLARDQVVNLYVRAADVAGEGVTDVTADLTSVDRNYNGPSFARGYGTLHQGTAIDGWWKISFVLPQGTPPGRYAVGHVIVVDKGHWRLYAPPGSPEIDERSLAVPAGSVLTTSGAAWDGVVTVVANPAG